MPWPIIKSRNEYVFGFSKTKKENKKKYRKMYQSLSVIFQKRAKLLKKLSTWYFEFVPFAPSHDYCCDKF